MRKLTAVMVAAAALLGSVAILMGCGGSDASAPPIAKALFVKKASAICAGLNESVSEDGVEALREIESETGKTGRAAEAVYVPQWLVPTEENEIEELKALGTPKVDEDQLNAFYEAFEEVVEIAKNDPHRYLYLQVNFKHPYKKAEALATEYGIEGCGQP